MLLSKIVKNFHKETAFNASPQYKKSEAFASLIPYGFIFIFFT